MKAISSIIVTELRGQQSRWDQHKPGHFGFEMRNEGIFHVVHEGQILYQASVVDLQSVRMIYSNGMVMLMNFVK